MKTTLLAVPLAFLWACAATDDSPPMAQPAVDAGAAAEGEGGDGCDESTSMVAANGGYVRLERFVGGDGLARTTALAEIYTGHSGPGRVPSYYYSDFPFDRCFQVPLLPAEPSFYDFLDAGPTIELSGPASISMPRETVFDNIFYRAAGLEDVMVPDASYQVASDLVSGTLRMPAEPTVESPGGFITGHAGFDGTLSITWQPTGADHLYLAMQQGDVGRICHLTDDGAFEVPSEAALAVPGWGTMALVAINRDLVEVGGRTVELIGVHGRSAEYERAP